MNALDIENFEDIEDIITLLDDDKVESVFYLGVVYHLIKEYEKARRCYKAITAYAPYTASYWYFYGLLLRDEGDLDEAIDSLEMAVANDDKYITAWLDLADVYTQTKNYKRALEAYEKVLAGRK